MEIILMDRTKLSPIMVTGGPKYTYGANRDTLNFIFKNVSLDEMKTIFTEENCKTITIIGDDNSKSIYNDYEIRSELSEKSVEIKNPTDESKVDYEDRVFVSMSQRTYTEKQLASLTETVDILVLESLMSE